MATVPGRPSNDGDIPKVLQPTQADMLIAAGEIANPDKTNPFAAIKAKPKGKK